MGLLIVFEGLDGSGISTQAKSLCELLLKKGKEVILTKEPTVSFIGGTIKSILKKEIKTSPLTLQLLFTADRAHHLFSEIEPELDKGRIVICDRYILSTLAFGGTEIDIEFLKQINSKFRTPDLTFILDVPPEVCLERIRKTRFEHFELFEEKEKFEKIRQIYLSIKEFFPNVYLIDGNRSIEEVAKEIQEIALGKLRMK